MHVALAARAAQRDVRNGNKIRGFSTMSEELHPEEVVDTFLIDNLTSTERLVVCDELHEPAGNFGGGNQRALLYLYRQRFSAVNDEDAHHLGQDSLNEGDIVVVMPSYRKIANKTAYFDYSVSVHSVLRLVGTEAA